MGGGQQGSGSGGESSSKQMSSISPEHQQLLGNFISNLKHVGNTSYESHLAETLILLAHHMLPTSLSFFTGPYDTPTFEGFRFFLTIMDDKSRGVWASLMKHKSEVSNHLQNFILFVQNQFQSKVQIIRIDQGSEFFNSSLIPFSSKPWYFTSNLMLQNPLLHNKSPYEFLYNESPSYTNIKVFGCLCFTSTKATTHLTKFQPRSEPCIFLGYPYANDIILFAEASTTQLRVILRVLDSFCSAFSQKISSSKSKFFVSKNVKRDLRESLQNLCGFSVTSELRRDFNPLLDKFAQKFSGWKTNCLTKAVLTSLPVYTVTTVPIPLSVCHKLDQLCKNFIWRSTESRRRMHKIAWAEVTKPKALGGLGIKSMEELNLAMLGKVGWRFLMDETNTWVEINKMKYIRNNGGSIAQGTQIWKGIRKGVQEVITKGTKWLLGNGLTIQFWSNTWLLENLLSS
ncbi:hypothetical protein V2J09_017181 [Rumex salicifolius]